MNKIIVIVGPTCTGKTKLSIELAKKYNGEIINADSTQIYKDNDIATAKVSLEEMEGIEHHLLSIKELSENYTVFDYQRDARNCINKIIDKGKIPILVGGTGLYIKSVLYDYKFDLENNKKETYDQYNNEELYKKLLSIDPKTEIHPNNRKRVERALDYYFANNKPISSKEKTNKILYDAIIIGLTTDRNILYEKINERVNKMLESGLLDEARKIYKSGIRTKAVLTPIGYKELFPYFEGKENLDNTILLMKQNSRHYAKRQYTWFLHQMNVKWFTTNYDNFNQTIDDVVNYIAEVI
mgnify:FL=1